ncbi:NADH-cytochrome b5 reductase 1 [Fusarium duplospermum]|uniref:NADH-cytochrome b5 reductase 1 n=1 Tax=Fusarium duplospermum TaxID=1325734 RepID=A0A428Q409_9HYPO|nr:NADH-cytochrome b5 reductase 1 [Fusarium duplospermum]
MSVSWQLDHGLPKGLALCFILPGVVVVSVSFSTEVGKTISLIVAILFFGGAFYLALAGPGKRTVLKPDVFQQFKLAEKTIVSHNLPSPESILGLPIGQHISIGAAIEQPDGSVKDIIRSYTPISGDHQPGYFDLLIKAYPQGNISQLVASLSIGQSIRVRGPKGAFTYTPNMVRRFGMIAGGTGITPMLQIIAAIVRGRSSGDRTKDELDSLARDEGIRIRYVLDKPPQGWKGGVGYITADMITKWLPAPAPDVKILLCGPPPMVGSLKKVTESLGYQKARAVSKLEDQVFSF